MNTRKVLMLLAAGILMSGWSGPAMADVRGILPNDASEYSPSADPSWPPSQSDASQIREPMETGAVPERSESLSGSHANAAGDEPAVEIGGQTFRTEIDLGP
ncbi:MAG: hypothetical protein WC899_11515 [bacterium]